MPKYILDNELKDRLYTELHERAPVPLDTDEACSHIVLFTGENKGNSHRFFLLSLCKYLNVAPPVKNVHQFIGRAKNIKFKWERHAEFVSFTFYACLKSSTPFTKTSMNLIPKEWMIEVSHALVAALHVHIKKTKTINLNTLKPPKIFTGFPVAGGIVCDERAIIWSDFKLYEDYFSKFLVIDSGLGPYRLGRLVQRMIDIETYRILALLGYELTQSTNKNITELESELLGIISLQSEDNKLVDDRSSLDALLSLALRVEKIVAFDSFRYDATYAYAQIVYRRLDEINEQRIQGAQRLSNFLRRRFIPAINTCEATAERLSLLEKRVSRASALIRTKIDVQGQEQSKLVLESMNRRVEMQLKLQQTVEALSVVAICYYAIGIFSVLAKFLYTIGMEIRPEILTGLASPIIIGTAYYFAHKMKKKLGI